MNDDQTKVHYTFHLSEEEVKAFNEIWNSLRKEGRRLTEDEFKELIIVYGLANAIVGRTMHRETKIGIINDILKRLSKILKE
jgi:hypothetical protein